MALKNEIVNKKTHYVNRPNSVYVNECRQFVARKSTCE